MRDEFEQAIRAHQSAFSVELSDDQIERLTDYYQLVQEHNELLHLVAPCSAGEFAVRHILESLKLLEHLPVKAKFADVGTGAGLPSIPCLIVRGDLSAVLIESKKTKATFLNESLDRLGISVRASVVNRQYEEVDIGDCRFVTARALDKFVERLPRLLKWARGKKMLLFGGPNLERSLDTRRLNNERLLLPLSDQRYLFVFEN